MTDAPEPKRFPRMEQEITPDNILEGGLPELPGAEGEKVQPYDKSVDKIVDTFVDNSCKERGEGNHTQQEPQIVAPLPQNVAPSKVDSEANSLPNTEPLTPKEVTDASLRLMGKVQLAALRKLEGLVDQLNTAADVEQLVALIRILADLKLTHEWTIKLERAIAGKPQLLGEAAKEMPLLQKLAGRAQKVQKVQHGDGREGGKGKKTGTGPVLLPADE